MNELGDAHAIQSAKKDDSVLVLTPRERKRYLEMDENKTGCVIRALESAFGEKATDDERILRGYAIDQILKSTPNPFSPGRSAIESALLVKATIEKDLGSIKGLIEWSCTKGTPLGKAMSTYDARIDILPGDEITHLVEEGTTVLVSLGTKSGQGHIAHAGIKDGKTVSLSDGGVDMLLFSERNYYSFVFTPREDESSQ